MKVLITGTSRGIGRACAMKYLAEGHEVIGLDLCGSTIQQEQARYSHYVADITGPLPEIGGVQILVNNAGVSMRAMFKDLDLKVIHTLMDVNFWGTVYCTKYALPWLLKSKGSVVGIVSIAGFSALPARTGYSASKYAIRGFLDTLRIEHLKDGLNVLVYAPGYTSSMVRRNALTADGSAQGETPLDESKLMSAEVVAAKLAKALYHRRSQVTLSFLGRLTVYAHRRFPRFTDRMTYRYIAREPNSPFN